MSLSELAGPTSLKLYLISTSLAKRNPAHDKTLALIQEAEQYRPEANDTSHLF